MPYTLPADVDERPVVIDGAGTLGRVIAQAGLGSALVVEPPPAWATEVVRQGEVAVLAAEGEEGWVRGLVALDIDPGLMLMIGRPLDPSIIEHMQRTELAFQE